MDQEQFEDTKRVIRSRK